MPSCVFKLFSISAGYFYVPCISTNFYLKIFIFFYVSIFINGNLHEWICWNQEPSNGQYQGGWSEGPLKVSSNHILYSWGWSIFTELSDSQEVMLHINDHTLYTSEAQCVVLQLISYKRYLECTLIIRRLSIYPLLHRQLWVPFSWNTRYHSRK